MIDAMKKKSDPNKISSFGIIVMVFDNFILPALFSVLQVTFYWVFRGILVS